MTNLLQRSRAIRHDLDHLHSIGGNQYWGSLLTSWRPNEEGIGTDFVNLVQGAYKANSVVFACELTRMALFAEARFTFRRRRRGRPGELFGNEDLAVLERPWKGGTTGDLLARLIVDADFAGTGFVARRMEQRDRLMRMRPDWTIIVLGSRDEPDEANLAMDAEFLGAIYHPGGISTGRRIVTLLDDEVAFFTPHPDPLATFRGTSWLQPVLREIEADSATTQHKLSFFQNGATPQLVVSMGPNVSPANLKQFVAKMDEQHAGASNAYKTLYLGGGASVNVVGKDLKELDFKATQGAGETRIAAASGVHPVVSALSEGLAGSSLNAGNFNAARRIVADRTLRPLWRSACAALAPIIDVPPDAELWFDEKDISFLQEDRKDAADIQLLVAQTIRQYVDAGFEADSAVAAAVTQDPTLLKHTGRPTVQVQQGAGQAGAAGGTTNGRRPALPAGELATTSAGG